MKRPTLLIGILSAVFFVPSALAEDPVALCKAMYPLPERKINFVEEKTGHDPRQFLIRRCISDERKKMASERRTERQKVRDTARFNRSAAKARQLQDRRDKGLHRDLGQQQQKRERLRVAPHRLSKSVFQNQRASRRAIVHEAEGGDRINAIRRRLRRKNLPDPCANIGAIRSFNNPCRDYGSRAGRTY